MKYVGKNNTVILLILFLFVVNCARMVTTQRIVNPILDMPSSSPSDASYQSIKAKWTVDVIASKASKSSPRAFSGFSEERGPEWGGGEFPLQIKASLMDTEVIEAGFKYYEELLSMAPDESELFQQRYSELHNPEKNILIEATLQTTWTEVYLDLSRWTIFLEDDLANQYEPVKITEYEIPVSELDNKFTNNAPTMRGPSPFNIHQKQILLYFSKKDYYGQPLIHKGIKFLKIVFLQEEGGQARGEGVWTFNWRDE